MEATTRQLVPADLPIVATRVRWGAYSFALTVAVAAAIHTAVALRRAAADCTLGCQAALLLGFGGATVLVVWAVLQAEEARLSRELRTARTGSALLRGLVGRRRQQVPILGRLLSTRLGAAAVFLADGDRANAVDALAASSPLMSGGRLDILRKIVEADLERANGTQIGLERCIRSLRATAPLAHREADLYRIHVLVKAVLQRGDAELGALLARELGSQPDEPDEEMRVYATWLRVWFDLDLDLDVDATDETDANSHDDPVGASAGWPPLDEAQARLAALVARAHGASQLVEKLEERLVAIIHEPLADSLRP